MASCAVKGGMFHVNGLTTLSQIQGTGFGRRLASMALSSKAQFALREKMETLNGATAGSTAAKTLARIEANSELGGRRTIETETFINTATVAGDITEINRDILSLSSKTYTASPVANGDGNPLGTR